MIGEITYYFETSNQMYVEGHSEEPYTINELIAEGIANGWLIYNIHKTYDEEESVHRFIGDIRPILFVCV